MMIRVFASRLTALFGRQACEPSCSPRFRSSWTTFLRHLPNAWFSMYGSPAENGLDFHAELAKADVKLPVIFISGHADVPMSVRAMKAGAVDFLTKPVHHVELLNAIRRAIRIASQARS